jgi:hypothetical protein
MLPLNLFAVSPHLRSTAMLIHSVEVEPSHLPLPYFKDTNGRKDST